MLIYRYKQRVEKQKVQAEEMSEEVVEFENLSHEELKKVNNDKLRQRLDELGIEYDSKAIKQDLIALLKGDENEIEDDGEEQNGEVDEGKEGE